MTAKVECRDCDFSAEDRSGTYCEYLAVKHHEQTGHTVNVWEYS